MASSAPPRRGRRRRRWLAGRRRTPPGLWRSVLALTVRPRLWRSAARLVPPGWWRHWPPTPLPPPEYIRFRAQTMYGTDGTLDPTDLIAYLEWCRRMGSRPR